jgi:cellulose synthase/poly-beta-1,6-N-acetylglucosamine synthase-like glycosyltransferase
MASDASGDALLIKKVRSINQKFEDTVRGTHKPDCGTLGPLDRRIPRSNSQISSGAEFTVSGLSLLGQRGGGGDRASVERLLTDHVSISVVIPTYRRPLELRRCLKGLLQQERPPDDVVVVVRESDKESRKTLMDQSFATLPLREVVVEGTGVVMAWNAGLDVARGDVIAFTDDDAVPRKEWLRRIEGHFVERAELGAVGGRDWINQEGRLMGGSAQVVGRVQWFGRVTGNHHLGVGSPRYVDVLKGANMSFRAAAAKKVRFDPRLLGDGAQVRSDMAFSLAVRRSGWKILYDPQVAVDHYPATRHDDDRRGAYSPRALHNAAHNHTLTLLDHLTWSGRLIFVGWAVLLGSRSQYGIAQCIRFLPIEGKVAVSKWSASLRGLIGGVLTWRAGVDARGKDRHRQAGLHRRSGHRNAGG